jgi:hypothetical protein
MPVAINCALNALLGASTAYACRGAPGLHDGRMPWPLLWLSAFQGFFVTPLATALFRFYPHWSTFYLFDPAMYPSIETSNGLWSALAVVSNFATMSIGFIAARVSLAQRQPWWARATVGLACLALALSLTRFVDRLLYAGDYDSFWNGHAENLMHTPCGWMALCTWAGAATFVLVVRQRYAHRDPNYI